MNINTRTAWFVIPYLLGLLTFNGGALAQSTTETQNVPDQTTDQPSEAQSQAPSTTVEESNTPTAEESSSTAETESATDPASSETEDAALEPTQEEAEQPTASENRPELNQPNKISTSLPASTAVVVKVCQPIRFDSKQKQPFPVAAVLAHPISDQSGNIIAPIRSLANLQIHPKRSMVEMQVNSVIVDGRLVPLQTTPVSIPVLSRAHPDSQNAFFDSGVPTEGIALNVVNNLQGWISDQGLISNGVSDILGVGLSVASGITSATNSPRNDKISELPQRVSMIFALAAPVSMSASQGENFEEPAGTDPCSGIANGSSDYSDDDFSDDSFSDGSGFDGGQY